MYRRIVELRSAVLVYLTHQIALPLLKLLRKPEVFPYSANELLALPAGTLGRDLMGMIENKELKLLPDYVRHDMKHLLLGYGTTDEGEVCLQCFMLGNRHVSFPVLVTVIFGFLTMPEHWKKFVRSIKRGRRSVPISHWKWFEIVQLPTISLQNIINNK